MCIMFMIIIISSIIIIIISIIIIIIIIIIISSSSSSSSSSITVGARAHGGVAGDHVWRLVRIKTSNNTSQEANTNILSIANITMTPLCQYYYNTTVIQLTICIVSLVAGDHVRRLPRERDAAGGLQRLPLGGHHLSEATCLIRPTYISLSLYMYIYIYMYAYVYEMYGLLVLAIGLLLPPSASTACLGRTR